MFATAVFRKGYQHIVKPILFRFDPEDVHDAMMYISSRLGKYSFFRSIFHGCFAYRDPSLEQDILGIHFLNPVGLSAGFDKNAQIIDAISSIGFGFSEVGSITGEPCSGNPKPRLWRLPKSKAIMVWYGLKNNGANAIARRLRNHSFPIPIGTSIARTNDSTTVDLENGIADYAKAFTAFADIGAYFTLNISCPNTCGGEPFTSPDRLDRLLVAIDAIPTKKPIFLKLPVDISFDDCDALLAVAQRHRVHGFIVSNLTKQRESPEIDAAEIKELMKGGISGKPTFNRSNALITHIFHSVGDRCILIGAGGIFSAEDAYEKILSGASLVQLITGMIYEGPQLIGEINDGIVQLLKRDGFGTVSEAIGQKSKRQNLTQQLFR